MSDTSGHHQTDPTRTIQPHSAAVIGRQLRQNTNTGGRTSGPLVPPAAKGRPRTPSHVQPIPQRPYSPAPPSGAGAGAGAGDQRVNVISGAQIYSHQFSSPNPHDRDKNKQEDEQPRLKCTWHCFCIALKALSGGIVLLVAGTIMSVVGFLNEAPINGTLHNTTLVPSSPAVNATSEGISTFKNLTYAGPVIMGLGGIVIVAACVLTFEVRDTLGVKVVPVKSPSPLNSTLNILKPPASIALPTGPTGSRKGTVASINGATKTKVVAPLAASSLVSGGGPTDPEQSQKHTKPKSQLSLPLAVLSDLNPSIASGSGCQETILETMLSESNSSHNNRASGAAAGNVNVKMTSGAGASSGVSAGSEHGPGTSGTGIDMTGMDEFDAALKVSKAQSRRRSRYAPDLSLTSPSSGTTFSHLLSPNIENYYFGLPSPQETECSDPDGCSLNMPARWRSSRCSCSGSPTHSMSVELYLEDVTSDPPYSVKLFEQQRMQQQLLFQQQLLLQQQQQQLALQQRLLYEQQQRHRRPHHRRGPKTIASVESDGLSSSSSSSEDLFGQSVTSKCPLASRDTKVKSRTCFAAVNVHRPSSSDQREPLLRDICSTVPSAFAATSLTKAARDGGRRQTTSNTESTQQRPHHSTTSNIPSTTSSSNPVTSLVDKRFPLLTRPATLTGNGSAHKT